MANIVADSKIGIKEILTTKKIKYHKPTSIRYHEFPLHIMHRNDIREFNTNPASGYDSFNSPSMWKIVRNVSYGFDAEETHMLEGSTMSKTGLTKTGGHSAVVWGVFVFPFDFSIQGHYLYINVLRNDSGSGGDPPSWNDFYIDKWQFYINRTGGEQVIMSTPDITAPGWNCKLFETTLSEEESVVAGDLFELAYFTNSDYARFSGISL